jgi:hypothetical protein
MIPDPELTKKAGWLRDIFGNPFKSVTVRDAWLTSNVVGLAESICAGRAFERLPILADALEDAGCDNADILNHCRQPGEHVRGCWVVDLVFTRQVTAFHRFPRLLTGLLTVTRRLLTVLSPLNPVTDGSFRADMSLFIAVSKSRICAQCRHVFHCANFSCVYASSVGKKMRRTAKSDGLYARRATATLWRRDLRAAAPKV